MMYNEPDIFETDPLSEPFVMTDRQMRQSCFMRLESTFQSRITDQAERYFLQIAVNCTALEPFSVLEECPILGRRSRWATA